MTVRRQPCSGVPSFEAVAFNFRGIHACLAGRETSLFAARWALRRDGSSSPQRQPPHHSRKGLGTTSTTPWQLPLDFHLPPFFCVKVCLPSYESPGLLGLAYRDISAGSRGMLARRFNANRLKLACPFCSRNVRI